MPEHADVPYKSQKVGAPQDLASHVDAAGFLVFTGTCPVCHGRNEYPLFDVNPGTVPKGWPWAKKAEADEERHMECDCPFTHPENVDEYAGCGAWWPVPLPSEETT
ncbi:hypothetical protein ACWD4G_22130 [Streptomyces sp. NPDC002643]